MKIHTMPVHLLIEVLKTLPKDCPVYLQGGDGNALAWSGQATMVPECTLNATTPSDRPVVRLEI